MASTVGFDRCVMAKIKKKYVCQNCGFESTKWLGRCTSCSEWNTFVEEIETPVNKRTPVVSEIQKKDAQPKKLKDIQLEKEYRIRTGIRELDRVLGGGIVPGSMLLLSGNPGIGKSTLLMQTVQALGQKEIGLLYISGEESEQQLKMRAMRLNIQSENVFFLGETDILQMLHWIGKIKPRILVIDSIQTVQNPQLDSPPGSVSQIRDNTSILMQVAKKNNIATILVGHVTKDGAIAGPRVLEHMVDTVLYFEGEKNHSFRILRGTKNRFGSTNEIGIFDMTQKGLITVENPSEWVLNSRPEGSSGTAIVPTMEGSRPLLIEIQGLMTATGFGTPRRMSTGFDYNRLVLLIAVMEKRMDIDMQNFDAYINVVGGFKIDEPSVDLAVIAVLYSSLRDRPIPTDLMIVGEVGLTGEVRSIQYARQKLKEGLKFGMKRCILPKQNVKEVQEEALTLFPVSTLAEALEVIMSEA